MFRAQYNPPGTPPATLTSPEDEIGCKPIIHVIEYGQDYFNEWCPLSIDDLEPPAPDPNRVTWINIDGRGDAEGLRRLGERFGLHALALEDVLSVGQRPKLEEYDEHIFILMQMVYLDHAHSEWRAEQVGFFLRHGLLVTIQEDAEMDVFDLVRKRIRAGKGFLRRHGADYLGYALLDAIVDHYFPALEAIGDAVEDIEDDLLETPTKALIQTLYRYKRLLLQLRRYAWPQREILAVLARDAPEPFHEDTTVFLRDCYDHAAEIIDVIENYRELTSGMMDLYLSSVSQRTNEIMRVLTVMSAIFIPLTFIAGLYGMNFDNMPELHSPYGYLGCLAAMAITALSLFFWFRRRGWIKDIGDKD